MGTVLAAMFGTLFSWWGLTLASVLDSSIFFFLPVAIDIGVVVLSARRPDLFWLYALLATAGSVCGSAVTYYMGRRLGEAGLGHFVPENRLKQLRQRIKEKGGAGAIALTTLAPPSFPFTAFVLVAGALKLGARRFFITLAPARLLRFGAEAVLAYFYGKKIVGWLESRIVESIGVALFILMVGGSIFTIIQTIKSTRVHRASRTKREE